jgi:hypothetical protein
LDHRLVDGLFDSEKLLANVLNVTASVVKNDPVALSQIKLSLQRLRHSGCVNNDEQRQLIIDSYLSPELRKRAGGVLNQLQQEKL